MTRPPAPALTAVLDELDGLRAKATPGPWQYDETEPDTVWGADQGVQTPIVATAHALLGAAGRHYPAPDAALIVVAVNRLPQLTAALRAVLDLADDWDRNAAIFPEYGDLSAAAARSIHTAITTAMEAS